MTTLTNPPGLLATPMPHSVALDRTRPVGPPQLSREQVDLIKRTIAKDTTDDELALFVSTCNRLGLDPFSKQIHCVKRWDNRLRREVMAIQVGIDGFRTVASRTGELDGQDGPWWCGEDGAWRDVWLGSEPPSACKVIVYRRGCAHPFTGVATYRSYVQTNKEGRPNAMWTRGADFMLAKCAEAVALRKAFPSDLAGVYAPEELAADERDEEPRNFAPVQRDGAPGKGAAPAANDTAQASANTTRETSTSTTSTAMRRPETGATSSPIGAAPVAVIEDWKTKLRAPQTKKALREVAAALNGIEMTRQQRDELLDIYREQWTLIDEAEKAEQAGAA